ncbi:MAG TPA: glycosyltransferase family 4 protein [Gemmatimonadaceae bacterium]|jgi:glycosyltransferase involved in cell wall biosynthesis|nr:glycosyltransferase family 4 protein [Gemmatimonadaceae bacterium]
MLARRRIVVLTEDSKPATGGIAEYLHQLAVALAPTCDVHIVSCVPGAGRVVGPSGVSYEELPWFRTHLELPGDQFMPTRRLNTLRWRVGLRTTMRQHLRRLLGPDTTIVLGRVSAVTHPWCQACRDLGVPYQAIGYGLELIEPETPLEDVRGAGQWFAISTDTARLLTDHGVPADRIVPLPPAVNPSTLAPPPTDVRFRVLEELGIGDAPYLLSIGMLRRRKGMDLVIDAFAALAARYPELYLVIAGDGPEAPGLRARAGERVIFTGAIDDQTRNALLADCTLFVLANRRLPNDVEGFGIVFLEAAAHGKAVVGGRNGGVPDAVVDGVTGLLVDTSGDAAPVRDALIRLLNEPELAQAMGERGRERACTVFTWPERAATVLKSL